MTPPRPPGYDQAAVRHWNLLEVEAPDGTRDPVVLHSDDDARAVLIHLRPGQRLGDHQVKERAWIVVLAGSVTMAAGAESMSAEPGMLFRFEPNERHSVSSPDGARILLLLAVARARVTTAACRTARRCGKALRRRVSTASASRRDSGASATCGT